MDIKEAIKHRIKPIWKRLGFNSEADMRKTGRIYRD